MHTMKIFLLLLIALYSINGATIDQLRQSLAIPPDAKHVLVIGQASHLDWDWLNWFPTNVNNNPPSKINYWSSQVKPTDEIFSYATDYLANPDYTYSVCEMGFLRRFWIDKPATFNKMKSSPGKLSIVGGGITSPDNLLPSGEAFIRDYLTGIAWLKQVGVEWSGKIWLPDDFGHDSQLPVTLQAMNVSGVSFGRLPGACNQGKDPEPAGTTSAHHVLLNEKTGGLDFFWKANDGSTAFTYYQPNGYCAGDGLYDSGCEPSTPEQMANCQCTRTSSVVERIKAYLGVRQPLATTPYIYLATGCDFRIPLENLVSTLNDWNTNQYPSTGVWAISSSFAHYADLVQAHLKDNKQSLHERNFHGTDPTTTFVPTPYWMGFYVSRVGNKQKHYETSKALVATEVFHSLAKSLSIDTKVTALDIQNVWNLTAPTTHHDFITGTATDYVFLGEQTPILDTTTKQSSDLRDQLFSEIANALNTNPTSNPRLLAFNQLGFDVKSAPLIIDGTAENLKEFGSLPNVQVTGAGDIITFVDVPSFGYSTTSPSDLAKMDISPVTITKVGEDFAVENAYLKATISSTNNWAITSLIDKRLGANVLKAGNQFEFRNDNGNIYRFGYEEGCGFNNYNPKITTGEGSIVDKGPARVLLTSSFTAETSSWKNTYQLVYTLYASEPFLRMSLTGAASNFTSVITSFTLNTPISTYEHGTPYHWDYKKPFPYGLQDDFKVTIEAAHDFFLAKSSDSTVLGAVYHNSTPSWGVTEDKQSIVGVLLRNSPSDCAGKGATGHDMGVHTVQYAFRVPRGLTSASTGVPLKEARVFNTGVRGLSLSRANFGKVPSSYSLASLRAPGTGLLTVAKPGQYDNSTTVFRVYYPDNTPTSVQVDLANSYASARATAVTALEEPDNQVPVTHTGNVVSYSTSAALTSFQVK